MLASQTVYEDAQYQATAPIGPQAPIPAGVHDIELSWDRKRGYMRVISAVNAGGSKNIWVKRRC